MRISLLLLFFLLTSTLSGWAETDRTMVEVRDGIYRASSGNYHSLVWVTSQGIAVVDPIDRKTAQWLKKELESRFHQPVRYLIYSHNHPDHALGGDVFDDPRTIVVSHQYAAEDMEWSKLKTRLPELRFQDRLELKLGGKTLALKYHGPNNGRGSVSFHFPEQKVLFVVDWIVVGRMPYRDLPGYDIHGMIRSTREVLQMDWNLFVGGHAEMGNKDDVRRSLSYLEALYAQVRDGMLEGKSLEELKKDVTLEEFSDLANFEDWRALNIEGVYRTLKDASYILRR